MADCGPMRPPLRFADIGHSLQEKSYCLEADGGESPESTLTGHSHRLLDHPVRAHEERLRENRASSRSLNTSLTLRSLLYRRQGWLGWVNGVMSERLLGFLARPR